MLQLASSHGGHAPLSISAESRLATENLKRTCKRADACVLQNEAIEGPYYWDTELVRKDIKEGKLGVPLEFVITVVDVATCQPVVSAFVDIWHCDALGLYSHFENSYNHGGTTTTFLRGMQLTDSEGIARMDSIFPGWYVGRTTHVHIKVHTDASYEGNVLNEGTVVHTGQLYFADNIVQEVNRLSPYSTRNQSTRVSLASDFFYKAAGAIAVVSIDYVDKSAGAAGGLVAKITVGIDISRGKTTTEAPMTSLATTPEVTMPEATTPEVATAEATPATTPLTKPQSTTTPATIRTQTTPATSTTPATTTPETSTTPTTITPTTPTLTPPTITETDTIDAETNSGTSASFSHISSLFFGLFLVFRL